MIPNKIIFTHRGATRHEKYEELDPRLPATDFWSLITNGRESRLMVKSKELRLSKYLRVIPAKGVVRVGSISPGMHNQEFVEMTLVQFQSALLDKKVQTAWHAMFAASLLEEVANKDVVFALLED